MSVRFSFPMNSWVEAFGTHWNHGSWFKMTHVKNPHESLYFAVYSDDTLHVDHDVGNVASPTYVMDDMLGWLWVDIKRKPLKLTDAAVGLMADNLASEV